MADEKLTTELTLETRADEASVEKTGDKIQNILSNKVETGVTEGLRKALTSSVAVEEGRKLIAGIMETQLKQQGKVSNGVLTVAAGFEASVARRNMRAEDRAASDEAEAKAAAEKALAEEAEGYGKLAANSYVGWWRDALTQRDQDEAAAEADKKRAADQYASWWKRALDERDARDKQVASEAAEYEKLAVNQYTAWWKQALAEKEQAEKEAAERAAAIAKAQAEEAEGYGKLAANSYVGWWRDALTQRDQDEAAAEADKKRAADQYASWWKRALDERDARDKQVASEAAEYEKLAVNQYTAWWKQALAEKEQAEKEAAERAAAIAKAQAEEDLRIRLAANKIVNSRNEEEAADYRALVSMYKDLEGKGPRAVSAEYAGMEDQTGSAQLPGALSGLVNSSPALVSVYQTLRELQTTLAEKTDAPLVAAITKIAGPAVSSAINAVSRAFKGLSKAAASGSTVFKRFGQVLVWRLYRMAAMKTLQQISQGFKNLESYSEQFGTQFFTNMQEMRTSIQFVGNAFAAMVAPILNVVLPVLRQLADAVANIFNRIGQSIASALGQSQYSAALRTMVKDTKSAGGKMKDILGFDELNRLSGDTGAGDSSSRMFEEWGAEPDASGANALAEAWERVKAAMEQVGQAFAPIGEALLGLITNILPILANLIGTIAEAIAPILVAVAPAIEAIVSSIAPLVGAALPAINTLLGTLSPFITRIVGVVSNIVQAVMPGLVAVMGVVADVMEIIITLASPILDIIATVIETVGGVLTPIIDTLTAAIELVKEVIDPIVPVVKGIVSVVSSVLNPILEVVKGIITGLANVISAVLIVAIKLVQAAIAGLSPVIEKIGALFSGLAEGIKTGWSKVTAFVQNAMKNISAAWESIKKLVNKGGQVFEGIKEGIAKAFGAVVNGIIGALNWIIARPFNAINTALAKIRDISILGYEPFKDKIRLISVPQIPLLQLASGGAVANAGRLDGTLINVNEAGPEVVANQGRSTGVMNTDQMKAAIAEGNVNVVEAIYTMMASVVSAVNNKDLDVYLDAQKVGRSVTNYQNNYARQYGV